MNETDHLKVLKALQFAAHAHRGQRRKGAEQTPYINHLIDVTTILAENGVTDVTLLMAGALHDTIEDTPVTYEDLVRDFGPSVADLVREVTDDKKLEKAERKRLQIEHAPHKSPRAKQLKIADKISNIRAVALAPAVGWELGRRKGYLDWAEEVVQGLKGSGNEALEQVFASTLMKCRTMLSLIGDLESTASPNLLSSDDVQL